MNHPFSSSTTIRIHSPVLIVTSNDQPWLTDTNIIIDHPNHRWCYCLVDESESFECVTIRILTKILRMHMEHLHPNHGGLYIWVTLPVKHSQFWYAQHRLCRKGPVERASSQSIHVNPPNLGFGRLTEQPAPCAHDEKMLPPRADDANETMGFLSRKCPINPVTYSKATGEAAVDVWDRTHQSWDTKRHLMMANDCWCFVSFVSSIIVDGINRLLVTIVLQDLERAHQTREVRRGARYLFELNDVI